jgi:hypothetical protein
MTLIGAFSLWRAYRTTLGMYQGRSTEGKARAAPAAAHQGERAPRRSVLEARLTGLSEPVSAIALGTWAALLRAPEVKMLMLGPLIMVSIFGSMLWSGGGEVPGQARPLVAITGMILVFFCLLQLMSNQFGFDRDGFRVFVLSAARRRDILLGKNLGFAPVGLGMAAVVLPVAQALCPMRADHVLAIVPQYISMFCLLCMLTNLMSIYAPIYIPAGSLKASNPKASTVLLQLVMFLFLFPLTQGATLLPLGAEALLRFLGWGAGVPIYLLLALAECAVVVLLYRVTLGWQGDLFQLREQAILDVVTSRAL